MKKLFLIGLMMLSGSAWAEWVMYATNETNTFYYDPATIRKDGHIRRVWVLNDLRKRHKDGEMSRRSRTEYDCKQERMKYLASSEHSEPMAGGAVLSTAEHKEEWRAIPPDTPLETIFKIVCANK